MKINYIYPLIMKQKLSIDMEKIGKLLKIQKGLVLENEYCRNIKYNLIFVMLRFIRIYLHILPKNLNKENLTFFSSSIICKIFIILIIPNN